MINFRNNELEIGNCYLYKLPNDKQIGVIIYNSEIIKKEKQIKAIIVAFGKNNNATIEDFTKDGFVYTTSVLDASAKEFIEGLLMLELTEEDSDFTSRLNYIGKISLNTKKFEYGSGIVGLHVDILNGYLNTLDSPMHKYKKKPLKDYILN